jgi:nitrogen fixation/metabolism regulation signal transduction histidine kinase
VTPDGASTSTEPRQDTQKAIRWLSIVGLVGVVAISVVLLLLLTQATGNQQLYERNYQTLFTVNLVLAAVLLTIIGWIAMRLASRLRRGRFGSRLLIKLAMIFSLVGVVPGCLIYLVSYQFVSRSIASWFDVKVERALDAGVSLGRASLDALSADLTNKTRSATLQLNEAVTLGLALERIREQLGASDVVLWNSQGQALASSGDSRYAINPERPSPTILRSLRTQRSVTLIEGLDDAPPNAEPNSAPNPARIRVYASVQSAGFGFKDEARLLQVTQLLPPALVVNALAVTEANREYQERALARQGLQRMYLGTLTLSLFLAVFGAILLAVLLGNQIVRPLLLLADGVSQVAAGNLTPKMAMQTQDELGGLTRDFATMTRQLAEAQSTAQTSMAQVDAARVNLQTILDNLSSGVVVLNPDNSLRSANPSAGHILHTDLKAHEGQQIHEIEGLQAFGHGVLQQFEANQGDRSPQKPGHWQHPFDLEIAQPLQDPIVINLIARGAPLPAQRKLLVFDDISDVVSAQRAQAWGEVARRLAHEIKNPLTPIQLSAERLEHRLGGKLNDSDQAVLTKSVKTIVDQVDAMKRLVNEFRDYARLPQADLKPLDLNNLIQDVMHLYTPGPNIVPVQSELDPHCPAILGDAQQLRQIIHNLVQNAQDATEAARARLSPETTPAPYPAVTVRTQWSSTSERVRLLIEDRGTGFPEQILQRAFEPYVTTKVKGTGLGLAVVKKIADEHRAKITLSNIESESTVIGARISISFIVAPTQQAIEYKASA